MVTFRDHAVQLAKQAKAASHQLAILSSDEKNKALYLMAQSLEAEEPFLLAENRKDLELAEQAHISAALLDRIALTSARIAAMAGGLREIARLPDPVREILGMWRRPNGLQVGKMRIPLGVIGLIYEARPNVTADAAGLCLKSGNAVILRGGSEAHFSNQAIGKVLQSACLEARLPAHAIQVVQSTDRSLIHELLQLEEYIDLIIPRGGEELIRAVVGDSKVPVIKHYKGVCHIYVDCDASLEMAQRICMNAKVQRPSVCNALETLLIHESVAAAFLPSIVSQLTAAGVEIRGCPQTRALVSSIKEATEEDWSAEYLDLILAVRIVKDLDEAIEHIERYGSLHTESIITENYRRAREFIDRVNSSAVMVNASTRFNDGGELGLGAEIGISTSKIHAFGPMGLAELTTTKFIVLGDGQIRE